MFRPHLRMTVAALVLASAASAGTTIYVDDDAALGGDGTGWNTAFRYLQDALAAAASGDEIRIAQGTCPPDQDETGNVTPGDREATFQLLNGVALRGGYAGPGAADPDARDIDAYETILSGDLAGDDTPVACAQNTSDCDDFGLLCAGDGFCIIAGDDESVPEDAADLDGDGDTSEPIPFDLDGAPRFVDDPETADTGNGSPPIADMGAYEFQGLDCNVDAVGTVGLLDLAMLVDCIAEGGAGQPTPRGCGGADLDLNGRVDFQDFATFQRCFPDTGP